MHEITLTGYTAACATASGHCLKFGTRGSYGIEQLRVIPGDGWEDMLISVTFHPPGMEPVKIILDETGVIDVPQEATAVAATEYAPGKIVFCGCRDGATIISADRRYLVDNHAETDGAESNPTPSQWEQLAALYQSKLDKQQGAENAGKVLGIGEDGLVMPVEQTGGGSGMPTDMELLADLIETDMLPAIYNTDGKILTDEAGRIVLRY